MIPAKTHKTENSDVHGFELHRPSYKNTKSLFQLIKAIMNQKDIQCNSRFFWMGESRITPFLFS